MFDPLHMCWHSLLDLSSETILTVQMGCSNQVSIGPHQVHSFGILPTVTVAKLCWAAANRAT